MTYTYHCPNCYSRNFTCATIIDDPDLEPGFPGVVLTGGVDRETGRLLTIPWDGEEVNHCAHCGELFGLPLELRAIEVPEWVMQSGLDLIPAPVAGLEASRDTNA